MINLPLSAAVRNPTWHRHLGHSGTPPDQSWIHPAFYLKKLPGCFHNYLAKIWCGTLTFEDPWIGASSRRGGNEAICSDNPIWVLQFLFLEATIPASGSMVKAGLRCRGGVIRASWGRISCLLRRGTGSWGGYRPIFPSLSFSMSSLEHRWLSPHSLPFSGTLWILHQRVVGR